MQRGLSTIGLLPIAVIFSIYIKRGWKCGGGQTRGLIKCRCMDSPTGFEVCGVKSTGSEVALKTHLHLTQQLEMIISRCITVCRSEGWDRDWRSVIIQARLNRAMQHNASEISPQRTAVYGQGVLSYWHGQAVDRIYTQSLILMYVGYILYMPVCT